MRFPGSRKYPKEVLVNDELWAIKFCRKIPERHYGREVIWGLCDPSNLTIYIKYGQSREQTFSTLVHELLHAIEHSWNIAIDRTNDHPKVYKLECAIVQILKTIG
jgi:hypothetical protein